MGQRGEGAEDSRPHDGTSLAPPPLRGPFHTVDDFLDREEAEALRGHVEAHFSEPHRHQPATHQLWNYWHVPDLYTYLRTSPEKVIPRPLVDRFHAQLSKWAMETLGLGFVTWPNLSLYVDGCVQHLHNDATNGRFGFVYSLTPDARQSRGGETIVLREGDLFRAHLARDAAGRALQELIAPRFNRLTIFDDRMPHGVRLIEGSMDPLDGRLVLHGHISEGHPRVDGPLSPGAVGAMVADAAEAGLAAAGTGRDDVHGPLTVRLSVAADGAVGEVRPLVDRVVSANGADAGAAVASILDQIGQLRFAAQDEPSEAWVPVMLGGTLSKVEAFLRQTPVPAPRKPAAAPASFSTASAPASTLAALPTVRGPMFAPAAAPSAKPAPEPPGPGPQGSATRGAATAAVSTRLAYTRGVVRIPQTRLDAFVVPGFLTVQECGQLGAEGGDAALLERLEARLTELIGIEASRGEPIALEEIGADGVEARFDFFDTDASDWPAQAGSGGQRSWTILGFLDAPEEGGQIVFPNLPFKITPAQGYLLVWNNLAADGAPNGFALYETLPVTRGSHRRFVKRYRERPLAA